MTAWTDGLRHGTRERDDLPRRRGVVASQLKVPSLALLLSRLSSLRFERERIGLVVGVKPTLAFGCPDLPLLPGLGLDMAIAEYGIQLITVAIHWEIGNGRGGEARQKSRVHAAHPRAQWFHPRRSTYRVV